MSHSALISLMRSHRGPEVSTLEEYFKQAGQEAWNQLNDVSRRRPELVDDDVVEWTLARMTQAPHSMFYLLLNLSAKDEHRKARLIDRYHELLKGFPGPGLHVAGINLHEYNHLLDERWLATADSLYEYSPEGAWGIFESAAMYRPKFVTPELVFTFERRRSGGPRDYFRSMLSLARWWPEHSADLIRSVVQAFPEYPADAVEGTSFAAKSDATLQVPDLVAAMMRHFDAAPDKAWEFFDGAVRVRRDLFTPEFLDALMARTTEGPGTMLSILRHLLDVQPERLSTHMDRYVSMVRRHPEQGIQSVRYAFQREEVRLVRPDLVQAVCAGFPHAPYYAYEFLWHCVEDRPELIGSREIHSALTNIEHATNRAFGFFKNLIKVRPEFVREGTLALFECLALEPVNRSFVRAEEMEGIVAVSEAAHIRTELEKALREPPQVGSRLARALMAIMFRQKLRARRHVLLEALRYAATVVLWRKEPSEKFSPIWDFVRFIIDSSSDDAVSTAAAERFLEGAFQLHYLCRTGAEHEEFLRKLDIAYPPARPFPAGTEFLEQDEDLTRLYRLVMELADRFETPARIGPLAEFTGREEAAGRELEAIDREIARSEGPRRAGLEERRRRLKFQRECLRRPEYRRAFGDPAAERELPVEARRLLRQEKKAVAKQLRDCLRAEATRIALTAMDRSRQELYRNRLKDALGRDVDLTEIEPKILPAFLWFQAVGNMKNNAKYLRRLIEDRISKRTHDWLRTEPPALEWAERVRTAQPSIQLDRWRAPFSKEFQYRPKDALAEKRRRIKSDLAQARELLEKAGAKGIASETYESLLGKLEELKAGAAKNDDAVEPKEQSPPPDPSILAEVAMNLERVRISEQTPDSDFEGTIFLTVESDPFEILFMGEYGFASCLSLRGSNAWSAVSNAIDIDKVIIWAKEPGGNVVGRRLLALTPEGVLVYRTYTNRHGLALDRVFDDFVAQYVAHCGSKVTHGGHARPLLSDRWYDDGAI